MTALWMIVLCGALSIVYAIWATTSVLKADAGNPRMQEIAAAVREGAQAYLKRQYMAIGMVGAVIFVLLVIFLGGLVAVGFLIGAVLSGAAGFIGMNVSVRANVRTAQAATVSLAGGLELAFKAGAITGMLVAGLALLGVTIYFAVLTHMLGYAANSRVVVDALVALGFGASLISIFARLGGGIFTKGAGRRRRSGRQGRGRHSGRRPAQPGDHRRQCRRQCRRLRRHGGRPVRDLCGHRWSRPWCWRRSSSPPRRCSCRSHDPAAGDRRHLHPDVDCRHLLRQARRQPVDHGRALQGPVRHRRIAVAGRLCGRS